MLCSLVLQLEAAQDMEYDQFSGPAVHGFWHHSWTAIDPQIGSWLHGGPYPLAWGYAQPLPKEAAARDLRPFTVSPLLNLPEPVGRFWQIPRGYPSAIRITSLDPRLSEAILAPRGWATRLEDTMSIYQGRWRVKAALTSPDASQNLALARSYAELGRFCSGALPRQGWQLHFSSPTLFRGARVNGVTSAYLFPQPETMIDSWRRSWNRFAPVEMGVSLGEQARALLRIGAYRLHTQETLQRRRTERGDWLEERLAGFVGSARMDALEQAECLRDINLLCHFAFFCGTGYHATQGYGQTRVASGDHPGG